MKKCNYCGQELEDDAKFCPNCGSTLEESSESNENATSEVIVDAPKSDQTYYDPNMAAPQQPQSNKKPDNPSFGWGLLGFFFPIVGLILFLVWKGDYPRKAKSCGIGALVGFIFNIIVSCVYTFVFAQFLQSM